MGENAGFYILSLLILLILAIVGAIRLLKRLLDSNLSFMMKLMGLLFAILCGTVLVIWIGKGLPAFSWMLFPIVFILGTVPFSLNFSLSAIDHRVIKRIRMSRSLKLILMTITISIVLPLIVVGTGVWLTRLF
jgi:hypothetical protein